MGNSIPVRAHNLLCLVGIQGCGHSEEFARNMSALLSELSADPQLGILVTASPDSICRACPNLKDNGCNLNNWPNEEKMRDQDVDVAARLGLEMGKVYSYPEILSRIEKSIKPDDLNVICGLCPWLSSGVCARAIKKLRG